MRNAFMFGGEWSTDYGVFVENPVEIILGAERYETARPMGGGAVLHILEGEGAMDPVTIPVDCVLKSGHSIDALSAWLRGCGPVVLPGDTGHYRNALVANAIPLQKILRARSDRRFTVEFECEGWRYHYPAANPIAMAEPGWIENRGTGMAQPLIKAYGSGNATIMLGDRSLLIDGIDEHVMIDLDAHMTYKDGESWMTRTYRTGGWPVIDRGGCMINWTGGITHVEITPRWRDY